MKIRNSGTRDSGERPTFGLVPPIADADAASVFGELGFGERQQVDLNSYTR